jgi:hypothetical protein
MLGEDSSTWAPEQTMEEPEVLEFNPEEQPMLGEDSSTWAPEQTMEEP